ncbi:hypothetical protein [Blastopirellula marina]|uniref:Uncharacterized protein n=1 Tax=Blastopirellula marina TaxID=124 RepID=A0A2S8FH78_9BACT|nr:hypothetical protein [Blastopirellula marina]PQO31525.1 hypothetical protein C5Y98_19065 [Blastopirellula marina]PTL42831.1 hypothetical protein C5Y97_19075 [Blastopirellula marina]
MSFTKDLIWGLAVPLLAAAGLRLILALLSDWLFARSAKDELSDTERLPPKQVLAWETCLPLALGAGLGYYFLNLGPWLPKTQYDWIAATIGLTVLVTTVLGFLGRHWTVRFLVLPMVYGATIVTVGYVLMPSWPDLWPDYWTYLVCWCIGVWILAVMLDNSREIDSWPFAIVLMGTSLAVSGIAFRSGSMRFAQITGLAFAVLLGLTLLGLVLRRPLLRGLGLSMMVFLAGMLLIAQTNSFSSVPFVCYWLPLAGPLFSLVAGHFLPSSRFPKLHAVCVILAAAIPSTGAVLMAIVATMPE